MTSNARTAPPASPPRSSRSPAPDGIRFGPIQSNSGHRIVIFGPGGAGKTSLAAMAPGPVAFFDLDESLGRLATQLPDDIQLRVVEGEMTWEWLRRALHQGGWESIRTIVIDSATKAEELAVLWTIANVPHEKEGVVIRRIEDYGFGKGYQHCYESFLGLLIDLDVHARAGRNVVLVAHDTTATVPNPAGEDWLRYEPRLQHTSSGKASIRLRVKEWADHVFCLSFDVDVRDGRGKGSGTRTIWPVERPHCMAKSRTLAEPIPFERNDRALWTALFAEGGQ